MKHARSFRDLVVYQQTRQLAKEIFLITKRFPKEETYSLTDQVRRSSRAIGAQIAEAWAKRKYERHFVSKLTDADGEQQETQHWIETAWDCEYITTEERDRLLTDCSTLGRMLQSMMDKSSSFCGEHADRVQEDHAEYFLNQ